MFKHISILVPAVAKSIRANAENEKKIKYENTTMYIKNRRNSNKFKAFGSYQSLCLTESFVLRNRLLFIA
jgi:hypothetical protein